MKEISARKKGNRNTNLAGPITFIRWLEEFNTLNEGYTLFELNQDVHIE